MNADAGSPDAPEDATADAGKKDPTIGDRIIRAGLIAGAITAIVGLGVLLWNKLIPDPEPKLSAQLERVEIERGVTYGDFKGQQQFASADRAPMVALAGSLVVQATATSQPEVDTPTPTPTATATATPSATPTPTVAPTVSPDPIDPIDPVVGRVDVRRSPAPDEIILDPRSSTDPATIELPEGCRFAAARSEIVCKKTLALSWGPPSRQGDDKPVSQQAVVSAKRFLQVLRGTRRRTFTRAGKRITEPLGVTVSFQALVEGFDGVDVRWSLHRASNGAQSDRDWLVNRRALRHKLTADVQRISAEFWVPMPRGRARSFIRVGLYDHEQRQRRAHLDTERFR